jgi:regulator of sigma E protease
MSESQSPVTTKSTMNTPMRLALVVAVVAAVIYLLSTNSEKVGAILMVAFGFGGVIMIHEFGHFIFGKMTDMKITAFSIGFSPVLVGFRRTAEGMHIRILPTLVPKEGGEPEQGALDFTCGNPGKEWETEYRIGLIPFGGFVALLGQEDVGVAEQVSDPRSFTNKSLLSRIAVIMAGVTFNAISALIIFMIIFHNGIRLQAPVIGEVIMNSPADKAGLKAGDEVVSIDGDTFIDYMNIALAGALSDANEPINMVIERTNPDGKATTFPVSMIAKSGKDEGVMKFVRKFGVGQAHDLQIAELEKQDKEKLLRNTGLMEKDKVVALNGKLVKDGIEYDRLFENLLTPSLSLTVEREEENKKTKTKVTTMHEIRLPLTLSMNTSDFENKDGYRLDSVLGMVPGLQVVKLPDEPNTFSEKMWAGLRSLIYGEKERLLKKDDVFVKIGECEYPTYTELRSVLTAYTKTTISRIKGGLKPERVKVIVARIVDGQPTHVTLDIMPNLAGDVNQPSTLGFISGVNADSPVMAKIIECPEGVMVDSIPTGATITNVGGQRVGSFYDIIAAFRSSAGKEVAIEWQKGDTTGRILFRVPLDPREYITTRSVYAVEHEVPFDSFRKPYQANSPGQAIVWGWKRTELFIKQAVVTLKQLITRNLSPHTLSGPLGIVTATYKIASGGEYSFYFYWLGLISASIAVMNLLPLPVLDGGVIVLMLIEKIKGSPISPRVQGGINYVGLALLAALMLYVTFNDIVMFFK